MCDCFFGMRERKYNQKYFHYFRLQFKLTSPQSNSTLTVNTQQTCGRRMTVRYIFNWQLRTPSVSSPRANAYYINMAEEWISRIMIWNLEMTSAKLSFSLFENVSLVLLPASWLPLKSQTLSLQALLRQYGRVTWGITLVYTVCKLLTAMFTKITHSPC